MATNLVRLDSIPEKWRSFADEANVNKEGFDTNGDNKDWIDAKEAKILEQKIRAYYQFNNNGFDPIEGQVSSALTEIGITEAKLTQGASNLWKSFTSGCEQVLRGLYNLVGVKI